MLADAAIKSAISLLPVVIFLFALLHFDSYKLVRFHTLTKTMLSGVVLAIVALGINMYALSVVKLPSAEFTRFVSPGIEEGLKALAILYLFRTNRIGFPIDGMILGFAVGTGFGLFENMFYLQIEDSASIGDWVMRGFGTAIMHGGTTSIFAALTYRLTGTHRIPALHASAIGLVIAVLLHAVYNLFPDQPLLSAVPVLIALPLAAMYVSRKSGVVVHDWLKSGSASHEQLVEQILSGDIVDAEGGEFIIELAAKLERSSLAEVIEYLKLHTELVLEAERVLMEREKGVNVVVGHEVRVKFERMHTLEHAIGKTAIHALRHHLHITRLERWELYHLEGRARDIAPHVVVWASQSVTSWMNI